MAERLIINVSTGATTTETLTSDEVAEREAIAVENAKVLYKQKRTVGVVADSTVLTLSVLIFILFIYLWFRIKSLDTCNTNKPLSSLCISTKLTNIDISIELI